MNSHPAVLGSTGFQVRQFHRTTDQQRRDEWLRRLASDKVLVADGVTLADVQRWLREALR